MKPEKCFLLCLLVAACSPACAAFDPGDEDIAYLLSTTDPGYGYDKAAYKQCVLKGQKKATTSLAVSQLSETCRLSATPKKCRGESVVVGIAKKQSDQELCSERCRKADRKSRERGECSLN